MQYECNPKHKEPWQRGKRGSLCPRSIDQHLAQQLLERSIPDGKKRYAVHQGVPYCAQCHLADHWHGYPVSWVEVPPLVKKEWRTQGLITVNSMKDV